MGKPLAIVALVLGAIFIIVAAVYFALPAESLPGFLPGHEAGVAAHHFKHGIGAGLLGLALLAFAWFQSKPRSVA